MSSKSLRRRLDRLAAAVPPARRVDARILEDLRSLTDDELVERYESRLRLAKPLDRRLADTLASADLGPSAKGVVPRSWYDVRRGGSAHEDWGR